MLELSCKPEYVGIGGILRADILCMIIEYDMKDPLREL